MPVRRKNIAEHIAGSRQMDAGLLTAIAVRSERFGSLATMGQTKRFMLFVAAEAWTDAALELAMIVAPSWTIRRLVRDEGQWLCTFGSQAAVPDWIDDMVEASHALLPLAILAALAETLEKPRELAQKPSPSGSDSLATDCDNYG